MDDKKVLIIIVVIVIVIVIYFSSKNKTINPVGRDRSNSVIVAQPDTSSARSQGEPSAIQITPENAQAVRDAAIEVADTYPPSQDKNDAVAIANQATAVLNAETQRRNRATADANAREAAFVPPTSLTRTNPDGSPLYNPDGTIAIYDSLGNNINFRPSIAVPTNQVQPIPAIVIPKLGYDIYGELLPGVTQETQYSSTGREIDPETGDYL